MYRDGDYEAQGALLESLRAENSALRAQLRRKDEQIADLEDKENGRVGFYLEFTESQRAELETENRTLHEELTALTRTLPHPVERLERTARETREEVRRLKITMVLAILLYWLFRSF